MRKKTPLDTKKEIIFRMAHTPILRAHYAIQKYLKDPDTKLIPWAVIAWNESHTGIINEAMEKMFGKDDNSADMATVTGGLGRDRDRLRYCFVISFLEGKGLFQNGKKIIEETLKRTDQQFDSKVEKTEYGRAYVKITSLVPNDIAPGDYVETIINECNKPKPYLKFHYFIVNTHDITEEEIQEYLRELKNE